VIENNEFPYLSNNSNVGLSTVPSLPVTNVNLTKVSFSPGAAVGALSVGAAMGALSVGAAMGALSVGAARGILQAKTTAMNTKTTMNCENFFFLILPRFLE